MQIVICIHMLCAWKGIELVDDIRLKDIGLYGHLFRDLSVVVVQVKQQRCLPQVASLRLGKQLVQRCICFKILQVP